MKFFLSLLIIFSSTNGFGQSLYRDKIQYQREKRKEKKTSPQKTKPRESLNPQSHIFSLRKNPKNKILFIISGHRDSADKNTVSFAKETYREFGVPRENIVETEVPSDKKSAKDVVADAFKRLSKITKHKKNVEILILIDSHGTKDGRISVPPSEGKKKKALFRLTPADQEFVDYKTLSQLAKKYLTKKEKVVILSDTCYSAYAQKCHYWSDMIMTSSSYDRQAHGFGKMIEGRLTERYSVFSYWFFSALRGCSPYGEKVDADQNKDGDVSFEEAFLFANQKPSLGKPRGLLDITPGLNATLAPSYPTMSKKCGPRRNVNSTNWGIPAVSNHDQKNIRPQSKGKGFDGSKGSGGLGGGFGNAFPGK